jgi:hypothetical protein
MSTQSPSRTAIGQAARAARELGMASLLGGNLFGRVALHPAVRHISDPAERGEVVNAAWRRYGTVNSLGLAAVTAGWLGARTDGASASNLTGREQTLARVKDGLVGTVIVTGVLSGLEGMRFARQAPGGGVPLSDGATASPAASPQAAKMKRKLNVLGAVTLAAEVALVAVNGALDQERSARRPLRRALRRW